MALCTECLVSRPWANRIVLAEELGLQLFNKKPRIKTNKKEPRRIVIWMDIVFDSEVTLQYNNSQHRLTEHQFRHHVVDFLYCVLK